MLLASILVAVVTMMARCSRTVIFFVLFSGLNRHYYAVLVVAVVAVPALRIMFQWLATTISNARAAAAIVLLLL